MMGTDEFGFPVVCGFPAIDTPGMVEVDRLMVQSYGITLPQMMENAGRALAFVTRQRYLPDDLVGRHVAVLAGPGGNGGGAMVAARRLANWGARVSLVLTVGADDLRGVPADQFAILKAMGLAPCTVPTAPVDLIIDGLIGYSLRGAPKGRAAELIGWANRQGAPILALDMPSGFDAISGVPHEPFIRADATLTLALPKFGLQADGMAEVVGALYLADISVPPALYQRLTRPLNVPSFAGGDIVRLASAQGLTQ